MRTAFHGPGLATRFCSWLNQLTMFYAEMDLPTWVLVALAASVVVASASATLLQVRFQRALVLMGVSLVGIIVVGIVAATQLRTASSVRSWLEAAIPQSIMYGLPALTSLLTVIVLRRRAAWERIAWGVFWGAVGAFFAVAVGLAVACGLTGDCL